MYKGIRALIADIRILHFSEKMIKNVHFLLNLRYMYKQEVP